MNRAYIIWYKGYLTKLEGHSNNSGDCRGLGREFRWCGVSEGRLLTLTPSRHAEPTKKVWGRFRF